MARIQAEGSLKQGLKWATLRSVHESTDPKNFKIHHSDFEKWVRLSCSCGNSDTFDYSTDADTGNMNIYSSLVGTIRLGDDGSRVFQSANKIGSYFMITCKNCGKDHLYDIDVVSAKIEGMESG